MTRDEYVYQHGGSHNIGIQHNESQVPQDANTAVQNLVAAIQVLRTQVSTEDRRIIDGSLDIITAPTEVEPEARRSALQAIAGVAALVGQVGVPVVEAIREVSRFLGS